MASRQTKNILDVLTTIAILITCAVLLWTHWPQSGPPRPPAPPTAPLSLDGAALQGNRDAPMVLIEWFDYECPFCGRFERDVLPQITEKYIKPGTVLWVLRQHPLSIHPRAAKAAQAALCATAQQQFWQMHAGLMQAPQRLDDAGILTVARDLHLGPSFEVCFSGAANQQIQRDADAAEALGLSGTPSFILGKRRSDGQVQAAIVLTGARSFAEFARAIDSSLQGESPVAASVSPIVIGMALALTTAFATLMYKKPWRRSKKRLESSDA